MSGNISVPVLIVKTPVFPGQVNKNVDFRSIPSARSAIRAALRHEGIIPVFYAGDPTGRNRFYYVLCRIHSTPPINYDETARGYFDSVITLEGLRLRGLYGSRSGAERKEFVKAITLPDRFWETYRDRHIEETEPAVPVSVSTLCGLISAARNWEGKTDAKFEYDAGNSREMLEMIYDLRRSYVEACPENYITIMRDSFTGQIERMQEYFSEHSAERKQKPEVIPAPAVKQRDPDRILHFSDEKAARDYIESHDYPLRVKSAATSNVTKTDGYGRALLYLETLANLPWDITKPANTDITEIRRLLDENHYGMDQVKERIIESIIVNRRSGSRMPSVICLAGAPGVGKTSITKAIAAALNLPLVKVSMGGQSDAMALKGAHRSYVGSCCSTILSGMIYARCNNPVVLVDEVDKATPSHAGDPYAALLEILDPSQNSEFTDSYVEIPFDLSKATFICTANDVSKIPAALRDRMEFIYLEPYSIEEREHIFAQYIFPRTVKDCGLSETDAVLGEGVARMIAEQYSRDGGARTLRRIADTLCRHACVKLAEGETSVTFTKEDAERLCKDFRKPEFPSDELSAEPGVVSGLAVTAAGEGVITPIECCTAPGTGNLAVTGSYHEIARDSIEVALNFVKCNAEKLGIAPDYFATHDIFVHYPRTYISNDGNSAGIANATAIISAVLNRAPREGVSMTGEITLNGRVYEVGGLRKKIAGAKKRGITCVLYPEGNRSEADEIPEAEKAGMTLIPVKRYFDAFEVIFGPAPGCAA